MTDLRDGIIQNLANQDNKHLSLLHDKEWMEELYGVEADRILPIVKYHRAVGQANAMRNFSDTLPDAIRGASKAAYAEAWEDAREVARRNEGADCVGPLTQNPYDEVSGQKP